MSKVTQAGFIEGAAAATPPMGIVTLYAKSTGTLHIKDDAGVETQLGSVTSVTSANSDITIANTTTTPVITLVKIPAPRVQSVTSSATVTPNADTNDCVDVTAQAAALALANPTGTPVNFQKLIIRIKDNGTARAISFGTAFVAGGVSLPTTTIVNKILNLGFIYNTANSLNKWQLVAFSQEV